MKRLYYILITGMLVGNASCKKFLEEKSLDEVKPATSQDLASLMAGEAYPYNTNLGLVLNMITDDVSSNGGQGIPTYQAVMRAGKPAFSWSKRMFEELLLPDGLSSTTYLNSWEIIYGRIAGCNVALDYADKVSGTDADRANMKGEALALRAYYYFQLVNMFGKPYNAPGVDPESSPGVPLKLVMTVNDELLKRNSVAEVYRQIETDLKDAAVLLRNYSKDKSVYKMNETAIYTLLSRVYLYQEKWDEVVEYANKALAKKSTLSQLSSFKSAEIYLYNVNFNSSTSRYLHRIYDPAFSTEVIWAYRPTTTEDEWFKSGLIPNYNAVNNPPYRVSPDLLASYDSRPEAANDIYLADLRARLYFSYTPTILQFIPPSTVIRDFKPYGGGMGGAGLRVAELYMNRAEAYTRKFMATGNDADRLAALNDINTLRISRYDTRKPYVAVSISDKDALYAFCKDERRREFPFDGHRWFDLRRYGMPAISHEYAEQAGSTETFTLAQGDNRYTLPIPQVVLDRNGALTQNP